MATLPPSIQTYHCLCSSLLLASTHTLSSLPTRSTTSSGLDSAIILPLPSLTPSNTLQSPEGYTTPLGLSVDRKITLVRREDGFEKRVLHRCNRCMLVVGYELPSTKDGDVMDVDPSDAGSKGKGKEEGYTGKVLYVLPAGIMSTDVMMTQAAVGGRRIGENDVDVKRGALAIFE